MRSIRRRSVLSLRVCFAGRRTERAMIDGGRRYARSGISMMNEDETEKSVGLTKKVKLWLNEEGYPTEFKSANICRIHDFRVWQGFHVRDEKTQLPREVDVVASRDYPGRDRLIRVEHILECKWSKDKPWIVFTSSNAHLASAACTAQTIGNLLGSAVIWALAGDPSLHSLDYFCTPDRPGFGGRQAFSKGVDHFYSAVAAVSDLSFLVAKGNEQVVGPQYEMPRHAILAFPVVVVEGQLYEAFFDDASNDMQLVPRNRIRCHWRGASGWQFNTTIDVVTLDYLDEFMRVRARDVDTLLARMHDTMIDIERCFEEQSLKPLRVHAGPRGMLGLPRLFRDLHMLDAVKDSKRTSVRKTKSSKK
jgi:hypothetical protein